MAHTPWNKIDDPNQHVVTRIAPWRLVEGGRLSESGTVLIDGTRYAVRRYLGVFSAHPVVDGEGDTHHYHAHNTGTEGEVYQPTFPGTTLADINGATHAYDDGTHWHYSRASERDHHQLEADAEALLLTHFQPHINAHSLEVHKAADINARTLAVNVLSLIQGVMEDARANVEAAVRSLWLGQHIQEAQPDYARTTVVAAIRKAMVSFADSAADNPIVRFNKEAVERAVGKVVLELTTTPPVKSRAQTAADAAAASENGDEAAG